MAIIRTCRVPGCARNAASRFAVYCTTHVTQAKRHGDPQQGGIPPKDLKPYREAVRRLVTFSAIAGEDTP